MTKQLSITVDGKTYDVLVETLDSAQAAAAQAAFVPAAPAPVAPAAPAPAPVQAAPAPAAAASVGGTAVPSPLAGTVVDIHVKEGQQVNAGDLIVTLEAMKMNMPVNAPVSGKIAGILVQKRSSVEEGETLMSIV